MFDYPANHPTLKELFEPGLPNSPALWAVLKGNHAGRALVDNIEHPTQCVIRTDAALTYFGSRTGQEFLEGAVGRFMQVGEVWLVWPHQTALHPPQVKHASVIDRLEFFECDPGSEGMQALRQQLPAGHRIQKIDRQLLERCEWRDEMEFYAGSLENFLVHGIGLCMMAGGQIIVEAYASALGKTRAEIGAITKKAMRGRGYAPVACAYLVEECARRGYQPYWSCDADHIASIRVAQKLGFRQESAYQIFEYQQSPTPLGAGGV